MEAVMRVRCSAGLSVEEYGGAIYQRTLTDVDLAAIDSDKAILVKFKHEEKLSDTQNAFFQAALLYTNTSGTPTTPSPGPLIFLSLLLTNYLCVSERSFGAFTLFLYMCLLISCLCGNSLLHRRALSYQ
jgi:protein transport protein SEC24